MISPAEGQQEAIRSITRLQRILEASKLLNSTLDLAELTGIILKIVGDELGIDRGTVFVLDRSRQVLRSLVAQGMEGKAMMLPVGKGIAGFVAATGQTIDIPNAYADTRFDASFDANSGYSTKDIYCMPIINRMGEIVGVLELMNRARPLIQEDEQFLSGVSVHIGLALENAQLHREILEKRKMEQELRLAREIQQKFYPRIPESFGGVEISASSEMCEAVGGDYLGYFPFEDGRFLLILGDVSGKGIGAALVMSSLHAACRALVRHVQKIELGAQWEFLRDVFGRVRWNAGNVFDRWRWDPAGYVDGVGMELGAKTFAGRLSLSVSGIGHRAWPRVELDLGLPF